MLKLRNHIELKTSWIYKELLKQGQKYTKINNREFTQPGRRRQQEGHKFAYLIVKNNSFARFARAFFIFDISQMFSFFLQREMTCFAFVWTTLPYDDKCSILSPYLWSTGSNLIPG